MGEFKVLITTSGMGSRLGEMTDFTNKSLVRVSDKPSISYIVEGYPEETEFVISLGHYGDHVRQFLNMAYPDRKFTFVEIDKYVGKGSSLGYSIFSCRNHLKSPFIFHACDTIIKDYEVRYPDKNYVVCSRKEDSSQYRTIKSLGSRLIKINEKGEIGFDFSYVGVAGIKDFDLFFESLENILKSEFEDISDVHCINLMLDRCGFEVEFLEVGKWFDIGNSKELNDTRKYFKSSINVLDKKDESIFFFEDSVIKFFFDLKVCSNRIERSRKLPGLVPEVLDSSDNFYKYRKAEGNLFSKSVNRNSFERLLEWSNKNLWNKISVDGFDVACRDFYISKTKKRIADYLSSNIDSEFINGTFVGEIYDLIDSIDEEWLCSGIPSRFHGDFILDNIIETDDSFVLIDWRQDFGGMLDAGDIYYDLSKMNHNLFVNHDTVKKGLFGSSPENSYIMTSTSLIECREVLHSFIEKNGYDLQKVNMITALIWINMAPLHESSFGNFLYNFGKYNLHINLERKKKDR